MRTPKAARVEKAFDDAYGKGRVETVIVDDLIAGDFTEALEG